ncbi:hypothetical protein ABIG06_003522 [Bradyrhizobium sp. USDA 326]|uniref:Uncharacterized protein n=1 Tax=Bradyrhizobium yuanmingense TaxID=108015 RepID=A0A1C3XL96_9BRAD|nr:hypothetical protein [Bradyrhizobium sp. CCBAU 45321]TWI16720.1 hypothetical protein IQ15_07628 [Bradyrhizobium yuanmingense]SCB53072.1 hypothetical protein GA0061099_10486 [Bradyrhizobium yuanmingense]
MRAHTTELDKHEGRKLSSIRYIILLGATGYSTPMAERSRTEMGSDDALDSDSLSFGTANAGLLQCARPEEKSSYDHANGPLTKAQAYSAAATNS